MIKLDRIDNNPILLPSNKNIWESNSSFNGCAIKDDKFYLVYRAQSSIQLYRGFNMSLSSIGIAESNDGIHFDNHSQFIKPELPWELYGCEDPRIIKFEDKYFIFYTALSSYPFSAENIKIGVAITKDFKKIDEKHLVTPFNAKAMALFPERINGKITAVLTVNTDRPPAKAGIAFFDKESEIWDVEYWNNWYKYLDDHTIPLQRNQSDQIEVGAPPLKTEYGWIFIYSYIRNYFSDSRSFGIEAALLDPENPLEISWRTHEPLLVAEEDYEKYGNVPNIVFPSGALVQNGKLCVYYGAADTTCCLATCDFEEFKKEFSSIKDARKTQKGVKLQRFEENPIIIPKPENSWEAKATFNPAAFYEEGNIHIVYRAMSNDDTSVFGYARSKDGFHIEERLNNPVYVPREDFEKKKRPGNSGCEDPRITKILDKLYMCYTAFDGENSPRVAMTSIDIKDFLEKKWNWEKPVLVSPPKISDKDACMFPRKINDKYVFLHRIENYIWIDFLGDLDFKDGKYLGGRVLLLTRNDSWDKIKLGIASPPIETEKGWLLIYHGIDNGNYYKVGAALLDLNNPEKILGRTDFPILEPELKYEKEGQYSNVVFPCGAILIEGELFVYYGGADSVVGVATVNMSKLLSIF